MEFKKREEYSIDKIGFFYQISENEFVHRSTSSPHGSVPYPITWMKGNKSTVQQIEYDTPFGVVDNSFFFKKGNIIKKAELINDQFIINETLKIEKEIKHFLKWNCLNYFIERDNHPNISFAIPINENYRSKNGIKFNISIDELKKYFRILVHDNFLFGITRDEKSSSIRRYQSDSEEYLEKKELPRIFNEAAIFNNWIFYLTREGDLISVNMNDLSYEIIKTNLGKYSNIVGIDENGMVNVQTGWERIPVRILTAKIPEKYIDEKVSIQSVIANTKRIEELERRLETEKKEKEELARILQTEKEEFLKAKNLLEQRLEDKEKNEEELQKRNAIMGVEMTDLKLKYNKLLVRVIY